MENIEKTKKNSKGIIIALIVSLILIVCLVGYIFYEKNFDSSLMENEVVKNSDKEYDSKQEDKKDENTDNTIEKDSKLKSYAYADDNDKYVLILNEYNRNWSNPKLSSPTTKFVYSEDQYQGEDCVVGDYYIEGDKLELITTDIKLTNLNLLGGNVSENQGQYRITLSINNNTVIIGNTVLYLK